jgi:hypothetical protein
LTRTLRLAAAVLAAALIGLQGPALAECNCWRHVSTETSRTQATTLGDVAAPSRATAWAVGSRADRPMVLRWNGSHWREDTVPVQPGTVLEGVAAANPADVWVVGYDDGTPQVVHWNGATWAPLHVAKEGYTFPRAVDAPAAGDAWIVGSSSGFAGTRATTWHWDGHSVQTVPIRENPGPNSELVAVSAISAHDVWAVGSRGASRPRQLLLHWDGHDWTPAPAPEVSGESDLADVVMLAPDDVWAVGVVSARTVRTANARTGRYTRPPNAPKGDRPLAEHWNGRSWEYIPVPQIHGRFFAVAADGTGGIWAGGARSDGTALLAHWDRGGWDVSRAPTPPGAVRSAVWGLAGEPHTSQVWAAGHAESSGLQALTWTNAPRAR